MKIGLYESHIIWENKEKNLLILDDLLQKIEAEHLDSIFLPEMSFTGFSMNTAVTKEFQKKTVTQLKTLSQKYHITIGAGWVKALEHKCENHYSIVSAGTELLDYTKLHPFSFSGKDQYFQGGTKLYHCKLNEFRVGVQICYDLRFPETFQLLSKNCDFILLPANWPARRKEHWNTLLKARAIENQCYLAGINCVGEIGGLSYSGDTCLINPNGEIVSPQATFEHAEGTLFIYELPADVKQYREAFPTKLDRREDLYTALRQDETSCLD